MPAKYEINERVGYSNSPIKYSYIRTIIRPINISTMFLVSERNCSSKAHSPFLTKSKAVSFRCRQDIPKSDRPFGIIPNTYIGVFLR